MRLSVKQVFVTVFAMLLTLGILRAAQWLYRTSAVTTPLVQNVLKISGVRHVRFTASGEVWVAVNPGADLMSVNQAVTAEATRILGHAPRSIVYPGQPSPALTALANQVRFVVAQGEATGQYVAMERQIGALARSHAAAATVEMGIHHLYITLTQGSHVVYEILPLPQGGAYHG